MAYFQDHSLLESFPNIKTALKYPFGEITRFEGIRNIFFCLQSAVWFGTTNLNSSNPTISSYYVCMRALALEFYSANWPYSTKFYDNGYYQP